MTNNTALVDAERLYLSAIHKTENAGYILRIHNNVLICPIMPEKSRESMDKKQCR